MSSEVAPLTELEKTHLISEIRRNHHYEIDVNNIEKVMFLKHHHSNLLTCSPHSFLLTKIFMAGNEKILESIFDCTFKSIYDSCSQRMPEGTYHTHKFETELKNFALEYSVHYHIQTPLPNPHYKIFHPEKTLKFALEKQLLSDDELKTLLVRCCKETVFIVEIVEMIKSFIKTDMTQEYVKLHQIDNVFKNVDGLKWFKKTYPHIVHSQMSSLGKRETTPIVNEICILDEKITKMKDDIKKQFNIFENETNIYTTNEICNMDDKITELKNNIDKQLTKMNNGFKKQLDDFSNETQYILTEMKDDFNKQNLKHFILKILIVFSMLLFTFVTQFSK